MNMPNIDIHAHLYPREWVALLEKEGASIGAQIGSNAKGNVTFAVPGYKSTFQQQYIDIPTRLKMMDDARVDIHALSLTSPMIYWAPPEFGEKLAQVYNDALSAAHLEYPQRFLGLATVPMQAPGLAVSVLLTAASGRSCTAIVSAGVPPSFLRMCTSDPPGSTNPEPAGYTVGAHVESSLV